MGVKRKRVQARGAKIYFLNFGRVAEKCANVSFVQFCAGARLQFSLAKTAHFRRMHTVLPCTVYLQTNCTLNITQHMASHITAFWYYKLYNTNYTIHSEQCTHLFPAGFATTQFFQQSALRVRHLR